MTPIRSITKRKAAQQTQKEQLKPLTLKQLTLRVLQLERETCQLLFEVKELQRQQVGGSNLIAART